MKYYFVVDEGDGILNIFNRDMFSDHGYLEGHEYEDGYHIDDYDIVAEFDTYEAAVDYVETNVKIW